MRSETAYRSGLIKKLEKMFPGCFIVKNDPSENQGVPDLLILFRDMWAMLELKKSSVASRQPNQDYYVDRFDQMSFAAFINPQNEAEVLDALQLTFGVSREARIS